MRQSSKLFIAALAAFSFIQSVRAETVKVFTWYVGQVQYSQSGWNDPVKKFYIDESPDFGCISGPKASSYYKDSAAGKYTEYAFVAHGANGNLGNFRYFIYCADRYSVVKEYSAFTSSKTGGRYTISGCVLESRTVPGTHCALIYVSSESGDFTKVKELADSISGSYPAAKMFVIHGRGSQCVPASAETGLAAYLTGTLGMTKIADGTDAAIYSSAVPTSASSRDLAAFSSTDGTTGLGGVFVFPSYYPVTFKDYDGTVLKSELVLEGDPVTPPVPPERPGYTFVGWDCESAEFEHVTELISTTAQYEAAGSNHIVTFRTWDGEWLSDVMVEDGMPVGEPPAPVRPDYTFSGWLLDGAAYDFDAPVTGDITLAASYEIVLVQNVGDEADFMRRMAAGYPKEVTYVLTKDLDFTGVEYDAKTLIGTLDGRGHSISGLVDSPVFTVIDGGTVKNLKIVGFNREHKASSNKGGLLADQIEGGLISGVEVVDSVFSAHNSNCGLATVVYTVTADADGTPSVVSNCVVRNCSMNGVTGCELGGVVGLIEENSEVVDCGFLVDDKSAVCIGPGATYAAGVAARMIAGSVVRCRAEGRYAVSLGGVSSGHTGVGGIVAGASGGTCRIVNCTNTADVAASGGSFAAGGIFGRNQKTTVCVTGCVNYGSVSVSGYDDGYNPGSGTGAGGIVGGAWGTSPASSTIVVDCRNSASVVSEDCRPAGGIVGIAQSADANSSFFYMTNCVNAAGVTAVNIAGGLVGRLRGISILGLDMVNCGSAGSVFAATNAAGGAVGSLVGLGQNNQKAFIADKIFNIMSCGALSTDSGAVGGFVGCIETEPFNGVYQNAYGFDLHGFFCLERDGVELAGAVYGKEEGSGVTVDDASRTAMAADDFRFRRAVKWLNVYAGANSLPLWVQTKTSPDLSLFADEYKFGSVLFVR